MEFIQHPGRVAAHLLACLVALTAALPAMAQDPPRDDERARLHFEAGRSHFEQGNYERALPEFEQAYELSERPALLFNIGATLERLARYRQAARSFEAFLEATPDHAAREDLESRIENLYRRAGEIEQEDRRDDTDPLTPAAGGPSDLAFVGAGVLVAAGVGTIAAAIFGGLALAEEDSVRDDCFQTRSCTPEDVGPIDGFATATDVLGASSAIVAAVGVALVAIGHLQGGDSDNEETSMLEVGPVLGPMSVGATVRGRL